MLIKGQKLAGLAAAAMIAGLYSVPSLSAVQVWTFNQSTQSFNNTSNGNSLTISSGGLNMTTTGWSDTNDVTTGSGVDTVETAKLIWANTNILGIQNQDENTTSPNHSVDSVTSGGADPDGEFDMLLLDFGTTAVNLNGIDLDWAQGGNAADKADISILAWNGSGSSTVLGKTWSNVLASNGGGYTAVGNYANVGLSYFSIPTSIESTKWLIGVYNPVFGALAGGDSADDGFKLASLTTSTPPPTDRDVPVPGTVSLILAGLAALRARGSRKVKAL